MSSWSDPQPDSRFADVDGQRIHFKRAGGGPAVVLLHGSASSLHHFGPVAATLSDSFDVIRPCGRHDRLVHGIALGKA